MEVSTLEPEISAFEELTGCKICLHHFNDTFFPGDYSLVKRIRFSHRKTHPDKCGMEQKSYCLRHCMQALNSRIAKTPEREVFFVHCRNKCCELVAPVYRNGKCVVKVFAGLLDIREKEKIRLIARILPVFAAGLERKAHEIALNRKDVTDTYFQRIQNFIEQHYQENISTADAARHLCISVSRLCHVLKENSAVSFSRMLTGERIYHAKQLMAFSDAELRLSEVAELCGFREYEHFSRTFKKETGESPNSWREKNALQADS